MKESNLKLIDRRIKSLECLVTAEATQEDNPLLKQLKTLREEIKTKAQIDYVSIQKNVLESFRILMEQLSTLAYYAQEADKDARPVEKVSSIINKAKSMVSEDLLKMKTDMDTKETVPATSAADYEVPTEESLSDFVQRKGGVYYSSLDEWLSACKKRGLTVSKDEEILSYSAIDDSDCVGTFVVEEGEGCLFASSDAMRNAFDDEDTIYDVKEKSMLQ
jgi:hypothetical protein